MVASFRGFGIGLAEDFILMDYDAASLIIGS